ncbi:hypothetical protein HAX54_050029, partial [Datura stramonium]|nr:hypothetical protein [Datura stramonium]
MGVLGSGGDVEETWRGPGSVNFLILPHTFTYTGPAAADVRRKSLLFFTISTQVYYLTPVIHLHCVDLHLHFTGEEGPHHFAKHFGVQLFLTCAPQVLKCEMHPKCKKGHQSRKNRRLFAPHLRNTGANPRNTGSPAVDMTKRMYLPATAGLAQEQ